MGVGISPCPKILAYITAYQDGRALQACLQAVAQQSLAITHGLVVDNSPVPLTLPPWANDWSVKHVPDNIGVAGGMALALQIAIEQNYDFLWLFDQDSQPAVDCLGQLLQVYQLHQESAHPVAIVAPRVIDQTMNCDIGAAVFDRYRFKEYLPDWNNNTWADCDAPIVSGMLISVAAAREAAAPRQDLFLDGVDLEYGLQLRRAGFRNLITSQAILYHHLGSPLQVNYCNRSYFIHNYPPLRTYYYYRNQTYIETHYSGPRYYAWAFLHRWKVAVKDIILTVLYREHKLLRVYATLLGTWHGVVGHLGKQTQFPPQLMK
jgi:rhamnosyltransferase